MEVSVTNREASKALIRENLHHPSSVRPDHRAFVENDRTREAPVVMTQPGASRSWRFAFLVHEPFALLVQVGTSVVHVSDVNGREKRAAIPGFGVVRREVRDDVRSARRLEVVGLGPR